MADVLGRPDVATPFAVLRIPIAAAAVCNTDVPGFAVAGKMSNVSSAVFCYNTNNNSEKKSMYVTR